MHAKSMRAAFVVPTMNAPPGLPLPPPPAPPAPPPTFLRGCDASNAALCAASSELLGGAAYLSATFSIDWEPSEGRLSSEFAHYRRAYSARSCLDLDLRTICATNPGREEYLSVRLDKGRHVAVGKALVYNRADDVTYQRMLAPFELWVGMSYGSLAVRCSEPDLASHASTSTSNASTSDSLVRGVGPYVIDCAGAVGSHVTLRLAPGSALRFLALSELVVTRAARRDRPLLAALGDSMTRGSWPLVLPAWVHEAYDVQDFGHPGRCVSRAGDLPYRSSPLFVAAMVSNASVAIIMLGHNDARGNNWRGNVCAFHAPPPSCLLLAPCPLPPRVAPCGSHPFATWMAPCQPASGAGAL